MDKLEKEIRENFERMKIPLYQNSVGGWVSLSQYGYPLGYFKISQEAEQHTINFYKSRMHLIRQ